MVPPNSQTYPWEKTLGNDTYPDTRADAGRSYYYPHQDRVNLHMLSETTALRLLWASGGDETMAASAVQVVTDAGEFLVINVTQEIILAAGTYRTPALLEYSGVGNPRSATPALFLDCHVVELIDLADNLLGYYHDSESIPR